MKNLLVILFSACSFFCANGQKDGATFSVAIFLYPGAELLDFAGPTEVFSSAGFKVYTVAADTGIIYSMRKSIAITPDYTIATAPMPDILVIPGAGQTFITAGSDTATINWIKKANSQTTVTMSVCTGAMFLSKAGLLDAKTATTHWGSVNKLQTLTPAAKIVDNARYVLDGKLLTTAGVSAGIDGALFLVSCLKGDEDAQSVARLIEYDKWKKGEGLVIGKNRLIVANAGKANTDSLALDPVCRMRIPVQGNEFTMKYNGKLYYFCTEDCQQLFRQNPAKYIKKPVKPLKKTARG